MNKAYVNKKQIQVLGYGGLIPFYGCVLAVYYSNNPDFWIFALHSYAVVIAAFLGAISWGVVLESEQISVGKQQGLLLWGVIPALLGWVCVLLPQSIRAGPLVALFLLILVFDAVLYTKKGISDFWLKLRIFLTFGVVAALITAEFFRYLFSVSKM